MGPGEPCDTFIIPTQGFEVVTVDRDRGFVITVQRRNIFFGYGPDTEKTEDMIDAVGMVEFGGLTQPVVPPAEVVITLVVPVVGGKTPVLSLRRAGVGRRTGP